MAQQNMYRVGDYVYFETMPSAPYQIRRIEELNKTPTGAVEAKVTCFFRRRDLPNSLLKIADQAERQSQILSKPRKKLLTSKSSDGICPANGEVVPRENGTLPDSTTDNHLNLAEPREDLKKEEDEADDNGEPDGHQPKCYGFAGLPTGAGKLSTEQLHELRQRELFLSRIVELLPAAGIRGKCTVVILNEVETCQMYLGQEDSFFYSLVYDPANQTLLADKGRIELGTRHQAVIPDLIDEQREEKKKNEEEKEGDAKKDEQEQKEEEKGTEEEKMEIDEAEPNAAGEGELTKDKKEGEDEPMAGVTSTSAEEEREKEEKAEQAQAQPEEETTPTPAATNAAQVQCTERERCVYHPYHQLRDLEIDQFLLVARAVGTFSRALDNSSSVKLPTLHQTASAASRDVTLLHAMALLHQAKYDLGQATKYLVPPADTEHYPLEADKVTSHNTSNLGGPILCRDQLEEWSASESTLFEDGIEKYGKDFNDIRLDCLPWKSMRDIVEYYYMWKTTSRYAELQKPKRAEKENKLKQVYIPSFKGNTGSKSNSGVQCESCDVSEAPAWYAWGPAHEFRLCDKCWIVWKKRGGLKKPHELENFDLDGASDGRSGATGNRLGKNGQSTAGQSMAERATAGQILVGQKGRVAFYLNCPLETKVARRMAPKHVFNVRKAARAPFEEFDLKTIQDFYFSRPITDVLNTARQVKKGGGGLPASAIEHLSKLHKKRSPKAGAAATTEQQQNGGSKK